MPQSMSFEDLHFDDLRVGQSWRSRGRTVTETDVVNFACLTGDFDPLHVNRVAAQELPFRQPIAHGLLGLSLVAGLGSTSPMIASLAFVSISNWEFVRPILFGDTLTVVNEIARLTAKGKRRGHVVWNRKLVNQRGEVVQQGTFETIVARRELPVELPESAGVTSKTPTASKPSVAAKSPATTKGVGARGAGSRNAGSKSAASKSITSKSTGGNEAGAKEPEPTPATSGAKESAESAPKESPAPAKPRRRKSVSA